MTDQREELAKELLPCPFCGHAPVHRQLLNDGRWITDCNTVGCIRPTTGIRRTEAEAITAWNTRTPTADREAVLEEADVRSLALVLAAAHDHASDSPTKAVTAIKTGVGFCQEYWDHLAIAAIRALKTPPVSSVEGDEPVCANCGAYRFAHEEDEGELICPSPGTRFTTIEASREAQAVLPGDIGDLVGRLRRQGEDVVNANLGGIRASLLEAADTISNLQATVLRLEGPARRLIAVFDQQRMTTAERIVVGISDAGLRTEGNAAIEALRAALKPTSKYGHGSTGNEMGGE